LAEQSLTIGLALWRSASDAIQECLEIATDIFLTRQPTSTPVHEGLPRRRIPQRRCAFFPEQSLLFPRK
jgi:hypothetical protein